MRFLLLGLATMPWLALATVRVPAPLPEPAENPTFAADVLPIFRAHCVSCHSASEPSGGLDLSSAAGAKRGGVSGPLVIARNLKDSLLMIRVLGTDGQDRMPMGFAPLTPVQMSAIEGWIMAGGVIAEGQPRTHWSYVPPKRPNVPQVQNAAWTRNAIDHFVLARLEKEGVAPSPLADKETLLRRVYLDLIGLPPAPEEVDAFLADLRPDAYERVVDQLLASPHYGERMARPWLDLARYADTDGFEKDLTRQAWKYRDWVIDAFNRNLPYDQFTIDQLAGDLHPNPTLAQLVATGFHRNTMQNLEGGVDQEEAHLNVVIDRVDTTATVWMGSTMACARCHDHKYDPTTQRDYYAMAAVFSNAQVIPTGPKEISEEKWLEPEIRVPSEEQTRRLTALRRDLRGRQNLLNREDPGIRENARMWALTVLKENVWHAPRVQEVLSMEGATTTWGPSGIITASQLNPDKDVHRVKLDGAPAEVATIRIEAIPESTLPNHGPGRATNGNFVLSGLVVRSGAREVPIASVHASHSQPNFLPERLAKARDVDGWAVVDQLGKRHRLAMVLADPIPAGTPFEVDLEFKSVHAKHSLATYRLDVSPSKDAGAWVLTDEQAASVREHPESHLVLDLYRRKSRELAPLREEIASLEAQIGQVERSIPTARVMRDKSPDGPLVAWIRDRGEFLSKTEEVAAAPPAFLPPSKDPRFDRMALAKWLVDPRHPLTARVQINRMWELHFGVGLVETSEDFGSQGARPSHPELLDWLATEFIRRGWDMKAMHRLIVTSSTYRQSSVLRPDLQERDPQNRLLARMNRFRMEAELIRDNALAASGLLDPRIGGPSVYPDQPDGIWNSPFSGERWITSQGGDRFRRGLYTFWKRTATHPALMAFDATSREFCTVRRSRTNTPLQALALMNDPAMMEAAKALAARCQTKATTAEGRAIYAFRAATGRTPTPVETQRILRLLKTLEARYRSDPDGAARLAATPYLAAWTMTCQVLFNLDETITRE
ncbi:MAG: PSD1 and planctomycete cytochrome C domain-containing protein [Fimbriimonadaceae bacterium]